MKSKISVLLMVIIITTFAFAADNSGANAPELFDGLYPIKYSQSGDVIFTEKTDAGWYNYNEGKWANAVTLDKLGQMNPKDATVDNITGYYVWIPRYAYMIRTGYNTSDTGRIDVRFVTGTGNIDVTGNRCVLMYDEKNGTQELNYVGDRQMEYLIHPAFRFDEELSGIWVGKYEASEGIDREIQMVNTMPNSVLWQGVDISTSYDKSREMTSKGESFDKYNLYGLEEGTNTHLIKGIEYGAVVYLMNSVYGENANTTKYRVDGIDNQKEYIAAYLDGTMNIGKLGISNEKYKDVYTKREDEKLNDVKGSTFLEVSDGTLAWEEQDTIGNTIATSNGVVVKENEFGSVGSNGQDMDTGFRVVITKSNNKNEIKEAYVSLDSYWWLMENGDVWVMGYNKYGQLGIGDIEYQYLPVKLEKDYNGNKVEPIKKIIVASSSTIYCESIYYLAESGKIYVSGYNEHGQLGVGNYSNVNKIREIDIPNNTKIKQLVATGITAWYLDENGNVYGSGSNTFGRLGKGTTTKLTKVTKLTIPNESKIKEIKSNGYSAWYLGVNGDLYVSGYNNVGQLSTGDTNNVTSITQVTLPEGVKIQKLFVGSTFLFLDKDGNVYGCGNNTYGELGTGDTTNRTSLIKIDIPGNPQVEQIIKGSYTVYYIDKKGKVYASGINEGGEFGTGTTTKVKTVIELDIPTDKKIIKIVPSSNSTWYLDEDGKVYVAGKNSYNQLGISSSSNVKTIVNAPIPNNVRIIDIKADGNKAWYVDINGEVYVSGYNDWGQLGTGDTETVKTITKSKYINNLKKIEEKVWISKDNNIFLHGKALPISQINVKENSLRIKKVIAKANNNGSATTWILDENGKVYGSGYNQFGQLGLGNKMSEDKLVNIKIPGDAKIKDMYSDSWSNIYYIDENDNLYVCGNNAYGQLGTGDTKDVLSVTKVTVAGMGKIKQIEASSSDTWVLDENGKVYVCGRNNNGELGNGTNSNITRFTQVQFTNNAKIDKIIRDSFNVWYIDVNGNVHAAGSNANGQFGTGKKTAEKRPILLSIPKPNNVKIVDIVSSGYSVWFIDENGNVYVCGANSSGQLGTGNTTSITSIQQISISNIADIKLINGSDVTAFYLDKEGKVYGSGKNSSGQLGNNTTTAISSPTQINIPTSSKIVDIIVNSNKQVWYIDEYGKLYACGENSSGELGIGSKTDALTVKSVSVPNNYNIKSIINNNTKITRFLAENGKVYEAGDTKTSLNEVIINNGAKIKEMIVDGGVWYLDEDGQVYAKGANASDTGGLRQIGGQLGVGHTAGPVENITRVKELDNAYNDLGKVKNIYGDATSIVFEDYDGNIYVLGDNTNNKLSIAGNVDVATKINITEVKDVGIGSDFSVFLKDDGNVVGYGNLSKSGNGYTNISQIAVANNKSYFMKNDGTVVDNQNNIIATDAYKIAAGDNHLVILKKNATTETIGQANSNLTNVIDVFAGKDMTVFVTNDNKTYMMQNNELRELAMKDIVYAELNGREPYFVDYDRNLLNENGKPINIQGNPFTWIREIKGDTVLIENDRVYDLEKIAKFRTFVKGLFLPLKDAIKGELLDYKIYGKSYQSTGASVSSPKVISNVGDLVTEGEYAGKYKISIVEKGKNLINVDDFDLVMGECDGYYDLYTGYTLKKNTTYTISMDYQLIGDLLNSVCDIYVGYVNTAGKLRTYSNVSDFFVVDDKMNRMNLTFKPNALQSGELVLMFDTGGYHEEGDILKIRNIQLELSDKATEYEPYDSEERITNIYLDEPLRGLESGWDEYNDYIDYANQQVVRYVQVLDDSGTKTIDESYQTMEEPIIQKISLPTINVKSGGSMISIDTEKEPMNVEIKYLSRAS